MSPRTKSLTAKQAAFVREYMIDFNATQAAIRAGYRARSAGKQGCVLLGRPAVAAALAAAQAAVQARNDLSVDRIIEELTLVAFADLGTLFDATGQLKAMKDLAPGALAAVAGLEVVTLATRPATVTKVKPWDKLKALELLGKYLGLFKERGEMGNGAGDLAASLEAARKRAIPAPREGVGAAATPAPRDRVGAAATPAPREGVGAATSEGE